MSQSCKHENGNVFCDMNYGLAILRDNAIITVFNEVFSREEACSIRRKQSYDRGFIETSSAAMFVLVSTTEDS